MRDFVAAVRREFAGLEVSRVGWMWVGLTAVGIVVWHLTFGFWQFGAMDGGVLINAAWQQYGGAVPYRDFFTAAPPLFVLPAGWALALGGPAWGSLVDLVAIYSAGTFLWLFIMLQAIICNWRQAYTAAFCVEAVSMLYFSWWWYNGITAVAASLLIASAYLLVVQPGGMIARSSFGGSLLLVALAKVNVAGALIVPAVGILLADPALRRFVCATVCTSFFAFIGLLALNGVTLPDLLDNYLRVSGRVADFRLYRMFLDQGIALVLYPGLRYPVLVAIGVLAFAVATCALLLVRDQRTISSRLKRGQLCGLAMTSILVCATGLVTNNDFKLVEAAVLIVSISVLRSRTTGMCRWPGYYGYLVAILLGFLGMFYGVCRERVFGVSPLFAVIRPDILLEKPSFFAGLLTGSRLIYALAEVKGILDQEHITARNGRRVYFGSHLDYCPAVFGLPVAKGLPLWWEGVASSRGGVDLPTGSGLPAMWEEPSHWLVDNQRDFRVANFIHADFDYCLFTCNPDGTPNLIFLPGDLRRYLHDHYSGTRKDMIFVFKKKPRSGS